MGDAEQFDPAAVLSELVEVEARLEVLGRQKAGLRKALEDAARRQYADGEGVIPRWELRGRVTSTLSGAGLYEPVIYNRDDWTNWVGCSHPTEAELVIRIPVSNEVAIAEAGTVCALPGVSTSTEVRSGILGALAKATEVVGHPASHPIVTAEGELVPGVELARKAGHLQVKVNPEALARAVDTIKAPPRLPDALTVGDSDQPAHLTIGA